jgi:hypothetical protein
VISSNADERHGVDGRRNIAAQWLQAGGLATENFQVCYHLLYSTSEHVNPDHLR